MKSAVVRLRDEATSQINKKLKRDSLFLDYGACTVRLCVAGHALDSSFQKVYGAFEYVPAAGFADLHIRLERGRLTRRWLRPQSRFRVDGIEPFDPFPLSHALPLFEWGVNWCFAQRFNQYVLLHAGALALDDRAVVMAAIPGSGKSTLAAALMLSGLRLLSDEFGVLKPDTGDLLPMLKPVALKNESISVIRDFSTDARIGTIYPKTRKGDVAHLAPDAHSVDAVHRPAKPALVIFPRFRAGAALALKPQPPEQAFARLAFNSFNYALLGPVAFHAVADLAENCPAFELTYSRLSDAITCVHQLLEDLPTPP